MFCSVQYDCNITYYDAIDTNSVHRNTKRECSCACGDNISARIDLSKYQMQIYNRNSSVHRTRLYVLRSVVTSFTLNTLNLTFWWHWAFFGRTIYIIAHENRAKNAKAKAVNWRLGHGLSQRPIPLAFHYGSNGRFCLHCDWFVSPSKIIFFVVIQINPTYRRRISCSCKRK